MPMTLVATSTLTSIATEISFSNIPQTGTHLLLVGSARLNVTGPGTIELKPNGSQSNLFWRGARGTGGGVASDSGSTYANMGYGNVLPGTAAVANTFSNFRILIPYYTLADVKPMYFSGGGEDNSSSTFTGNQALVSWYSSSTSAFTSLAIVCNTGNMVANSSASLYIIS